MVKGLHTLSYKCKSKTLKRRRRIKRNKESQILGDIKKNGFAMIYCFPLTKETFILTNAFWLSRYRVDS